ncbi:MAG: hypothetical protein HY351_03470, partial [Candidatus Omnitrophica bacterium]|nr:hypothetical protein [Candidatus Omnitrophota bacterium]
MRKQLTNKLVTTTLLFFFVTTGTVYSYQAPSVSDPVSNVGQGIDPASAGVDQVDKSAAIIQPDLNPYNIAVPEELGSIEEVFQGTPNSPMIIHIQNVHANYEAQVNIKGILNHLVEQYQFSLIQLEGAVSKLDPTILQPSYLKEANLKLVDFLMREGRMSGADAFAVETDKPVELYGIEDQSLYMENLKMFKSIYKHQEELKPYFDEMHRLILSVGPKLLNPELLDFTRKTEEFSTDKIDVLDYLTYMNKLSEKHNFISLNDLKQMVEYPNLVRLMRLQKLEEELNKNGLKKEREALKLEFHKKMPDSQKAEELLAHLDESTKGVNPRSYFMKLTELADEAKIDFIIYPAFRIFAEFLIHQDEIDHQALFSELKRFEQFLQEKLFTGEDEKDLLQMIDFVGLLEPYFRLEMSREKIALYLKNKDQIKPSWISDHLGELAQKQGVTVKPAGDVQQLDSYLVDIEYFYQLVLKRDQVFTEKVLSRMKSLAKEKTILITGGFHQDGLIDYFRKENISYVVINPKVDVKEGNKSYLKVMLDEEAVVGSVFAGTFALEIKELLDGLLQTDRDRVALRNFYAAIAPVAFTLDQRDRRAVIQAANDQFRKVAAVSGVLLNVKSADVGEEIIKLTVEAALAQENEERRYSLEATYRIRTNNFEVSVIRELPPEGELQKVWRFPRLTRVPVTDLNPEIIGAAKTIDLSRITTPFPRPFRPLTLRDLSDGSNFLLGDRFLPPNTPVAEEAKEVTQALLSASQAEVKRVRTELRRGEVLTPVVVERALDFGARQAVTPVAIDQAGLPQNFSDFLKFTNSINTSDQPRYLALVINPDQKVAQAQLEAIRGVLMLDKNVAVSTYGIEGMLGLLLTTFGITHDQLETQEPYIRIRVVDKGIVDLKGAVQAFAKDLSAVEPWQGHLIDSVEAAGSYVKAKEFMKRVGLLIPTGDLGKLISGKIIVEETLQIQELGFDDRAIAGNVDRMVAVGYAQVKLLAKMAGVEPAAILRQIQDIAFAMQKIGFN